MSQCKVMSWRRINGDGCLQTPVVYDYPFNYRIVKFSILALIIPHFLKVTNQMVCRPLWEVGRFLIQLLHSTMPCKLWMEIKRHDLARANELKSTIHYESTPRKTALSCLNFHLFNHSWILLAHWPVKSISLSNHKKPSLLAVPWNTWWQHPPTHPYVHNSVVGLSRKYKCASWANTWQKWRAKLIKRRKDTGIWVN